MKRRDFISRTSGAAAALGMPLPHFEVSGDGGRSAEERLALSQALQRVGAVLKIQRVEGDDRYRGGFISPAYGFPVPSLNAVELKNLGAVFCHEESTHHHDAKLAERIDLALGWLEREQHADGTVDLPTTNFHSPPDTAFVVIDLVPLYRLLQRDGSSEARRWLPRLESFLRRAAGAIATGGIHTPNHRWVASAALAGSYALFGEAAYRRRIDAWLGEGIDCNEDGEYNELSNAIYNPISNRALLTIAEALDLEIRAEARTRLAEAEAARQIARTRRTVVLPLSAAVFDGAVKDFNAMQIGVLDLLRERRARLDAGRAAITATADYWQAQARLDLLLAGARSAASATAAAATSGARTPEPGH